MKLRPRKREKRCYELSCLYLQLDERYNDGSWSLVQGEVTSRQSPVPYGHAWLVSSDGRVYDPVHNKIYEAADYEAQFKANALNTYSLAESERMSGKHGHFGPWVQPEGGMRKLP
jgi:hypothetical protein